MENMDVNSEAKQASKKPSKMKAIFAAVFAVVLVLGGVYYFVFGQQAGDTPPSLSPQEPSLYQGFIGDFNGGKKFLEMDQANITAWADKVNEIGNENLKDLDVTAGNEGLFFLSSAKELSFEDVLGHIEAKQDIQYFAGRYDMDHIFNTTPNEYYNKEVIKEIALDDLKNVKFAAGEGIIFGSTAGKLKYDGTALLASDVPAKVVKDYCADLKEEEWNLVRISSENASGFTSKDVMNAFDKCMDSVEAIWPLSPTLTDVVDAEGVTTGTELAYFPAEASLDGIKNRSYEIADHTDHYIAWVKFGKKAETPTETPKEEQSTETPKEEPAAAKVECENYAEYNDVQNYADAFRDATVNVDTSQLYCLLDDTAKAQLLDVVMDASNDLNLINTVNAMAVLAPKFYVIFDDDDLLGTYLRFLEVGDKQTLISAFEANKKDANLAFISLLQGSSLTDLTSANASLAFLEAFDEFLGGIRSNSLFSNDIQDTLKILNNADVYVNLFDQNLGTVDEKGNIVDDYGNILVLTSSDDVSAIEAEFVNNEVVKVRIDVVPDANNNTITRTYEGPDEDSNIISLTKTETVEPVHLNIDLIKDEIGIKGTSDGSTTLPAIIEPLDSIMTGYVNDEGAKFAALPDFLTAISPLVDDFIASTDPKSLFDILVEFVDFANAAGGNVTIEEYTEAAGSNGMTFGSNALSQWFGPFHGKPILVTNESSSTAGSEIAAGYPTGAIMYMSNAGVTGVTDYAAYIVPRTGEQVRKVDLFDLPSDDGIGYALKIYTINITGDSNGLGSTIGTGNYISFQEEGGIDLVNAWLSQQTGATSGEASESGLDITQAINDANAAVTAVTTAIATANDAVTVLSSLKKDYMSDETQAAIDGFETIATDALGKATETERMVNGYAAAAAAATTLDGAMAAATSATAEAVKATGFADIAVAALADAQAAAAGTATDGVTGATTGALN